jgi:anti-sigma regulatory factor (Ser/Thr protein kinase)
MSDAVDLTHLGGRSPTPVGDEVCFELPAEHRAVADVRRLVRHYVDGSLPDERVDDVVLAASELATNAVEHAGAPTFRVSLRRQPLAVLLAVHTAAADGLDLTRLRRADALADPTALRGRGLGIVRAVSDEFDIGTADGQLTVRCRFRCG